MVCVPAALAGPTARGKALDGRFEGGLGVLQFETDPGGHVVGRYGEGGPCQFDPKRPVVDGDFEGSVFVGTVTICQSGPACEERAYPVLAFMDQDGVLAADVKLEPGCSSKVLKGSRLYLKSSPGSVVFAAAKVPRKLTKKQQLDACIEQLKHATFLLQKRDYAGAAFYFEQGLSCEPENWAAHLGIGIAELRRDRVDKAMESFARAQASTKREGQDESSIQFSFACGYTRLGDKEKALASLTAAVEAGWADPKAMVDDPDLQPLRDDPTFKSLVDKAWDLKEKQPNQEQPQ